MAKVLKTSRAEPVTYYTADGGAYNFFVGSHHPGSNGSQLIMKDEHAEELLRKYPDEMSEVPHDKWSGMQKEKAGGFIESVTKEAAEKFPVLKNKILGKKPK